MTSINVPTSFNNFDKDKVYQIILISPHNQIIAKIGTLQGLCQWSKNQSRVFLYQNFIKKEGRLSEFEKIFTFILGVGMGNFAKAELWLKYLANCDPEKITFGLFNQKINDYLANQKKFK